MRMLGRERGGMSLQSIAYSDVFEEESRGVDRGCRGIVTRGGIA